MEELIVNKQADPTSNSPGQATIDANLTMNVVTTGDGGVNTSSLDLNEFNQTMSSGKNVKMDLVKLPSSGKGGELVERSLSSKIFHGKGLGWLFGYDNNYYETTINLNVNLSIKPNTTIDDAISAYNSNPAANGIIASADYRHNREVGLKKHFFNEMPYKYGNDPNWINALAGGRADNMMSMRANIYGVSGPLLSVPDDLTTAEVIIHEIGHVIGAVGKHNIPGNEYWRTGMPSNEHGKVYPTANDLLKMLNDPENRSTIKP